MKQRCPECGKFMKLTDYIPREDEDFDDDLALACGYIQEQVDTANWFEEPLCRFIYVQNLWECVDPDCDTWVSHTEGPKYYYNPETNNYDAPKPLTLKEQAEIERLKQEEAGQLRLDL